LRLLIGNTARIQLLHSRARKRGRLLLQIEEIPPDRGNAPFDINEIERIARHRSSRRRDLALPCDLRLYLFPRRIETVHSTNAELIFELGGTTRPSRQRLVGDLDRPVSGSIAAP
jgi:hypothetical protein